MRRAVCLPALVVMILGAAAGAHAQVRPGAPPRDTAAAAPKGTATIHGRVVAADGGEPLVRATIRISGSALPQALTANTNSKGIYQLPNLPAGRYTVTASRSGYLELQNGQRYPNEPGTPVEVIDESTVAIDFALPRTSVISGRITDETGDIVPNIHVWAMQERFYERQRRLVPVAQSATTDDTGNYRITGLAPGDYVLMTVLRETWRSKEDDKQVFSYAPSYYPSTASQSDAQRITVGLGQEVGAIDISLVAVRAARLSGTALLADGTPLPGAAVELSYRVTGPSGGSFWSIGSTKTAPDGTWTIRDVPPGEFDLSVTADPKEGSHTATMLVSVHGADVSGIVITPALPATISGLVVTDDGEPLPNTPRLRVMPESLAPGVDSRFVATTSTATGVVGDDGRFTFGNVRPGPTLLRIAQLPAEWGVRSVHVGGRDHTDVPFEIRGAQALSDIRVVLSRTLPEVSARVVDDEGRTADGTVLLFPADAARWHEAARTLHYGRPDQHGQIRFAPVRPGEYLAIALDYVQTWQATDPAFLDGLRRRAVKVQVAEGENEPLTLRVQR
jgi:hypothetical protein